MQRVLPWTFLVVGVVVGYLAAGLGNRPLPGPVPPAAQSTPAPSGDLLPFALRDCSGDCIGEVDLFTGIKPSDGDQPRALSGLPVPSPSSPSPLRSSRPFSILSNMSVNHGGLARDARAGRTDRQPVFTITIPEDPDDHYPHRRLQTLYIEHGSGKPYRLATCLVLDQYDVTQYCGHDGKTLNHQP